MIDSVFGVFTLGLLTSLVLTGICGFGALWQHLSAKRSLQRSVGQLEGQRIVGHGLIFALCSWRSRKIV